MVMHCDWTPNVSDTRTHKLNHCSVSSCFSFLFQRWGPRRSSKFAQGYSCGQFGAKLFIVTSRLEICSQEDVPSHPWSLFIVFGLQSTGQHCSHGHRAITTEGILSVNPSSVHRYSPGLGIFCKLNAIHKIWVLRKDKRGLGNSSKVVIEEKKNVPKLWKRKKQFRFKSFILKF